MAFAARELDLRDAAHNWLLVASAVTYSFMSFSYYTGSS
ncbi:hypothetical protein US8_00164 [Bacillus altitudinis]|nr:hypothetical protein US8_00164 [Bacillus altitudinis]